MFNFSEKQIKKKKKARSMGMELDRTLYRTNTKTTDSEIDVGAVFVVQVLFKSRVTKKKRLRF